MFKRISRPFVNLWKKFWKLSKKKKAAVIVVVLIVGFVVNRMVNKPNPAGEYELETAKIDSIVEHVSETGNVTAAGVTPVYSTTTGIVEEVFVENGSYVTDGGKLFAVKATATKQEKDSALANYLQAKAALETAEATQLSLQAQMFTEWDQFKELAESDDYEDADGNPKNPERNVPEFHVPEKEWLAAEALYKKQQQVIAQARASVSATWQAYQATQDSEVVAVIGGQVQNLAVSTGDRIEAKSTTGGSPALIVMEEGVATTIKLDVGETDIIKIHPGQMASVEVDAISGKTFEGYVDRVDSVATPTSGVVNYSVYVKLSQTDAMILSGMTVDVDITVDSVEGVLTVSSSAVKPYEGGRAVRVVGDGGEIEYIPVETGASGGGRTQIVSGIDEGQEVIVALTNEQVDRGPGLF